MITVRVSIVFVDGEMINRLVHLLVGKRSQRLLLQLDLCRSSGKREQKLRDLPVADFTG
jgi:hypothetical protein